jgi:hypothetical protein
VKYEFSLLPRYFSSSQLRSNTQLNWSRHLIIVRAHVHFCGPWKLLTRPKMRQLCPSGRYRVVVTREYFLGDSMSFSPFLTTDIFLLRELAWELVSGTRFENSLRKLASGTRFVNSLWELASGTRLQKLDSETQFWNSIRELTSETCFANLLRELASETCFGSVPPNSHFVCGKIFLFKEKSWQMTPTAQATIWHMNLGTISLDDNLKKWTKDDFKNEKVSFNILPVQWVAWPLKAFEQKPFYKGTNLDNALIIMVLKSAGRNLLRFMFSHNLIYNTF